MKVIVKDYLNVRVGKPNVNAPCYQYLAPGSELEVDGELYDGDFFEGVNKWMKDLAGNYYWSGGLSGTEKKVETQITYKWLDQLGVKNVWENYKVKGSNVKIAVLDTGYNKENSDIENAVFLDTVIIDEKNYKNDSLVINDKSGDGHGSRCASLIGARNQLKWVIGIAPECELLIGKISANKEIKSFEYILKGIEWAIKQGSDIISISYSFEFKPEEVHFWETQFDSLLKDNNVIVFAAAGNTDGSIQSGETYPASFLQCVSVGAIDESKNLSNMTLLSEKTILHAPGINIESFGKNDYPEIGSGTSFSTPILAGISALAISYLKGKGQSIQRTSFIKDLISSGDDLLNYNNKKSINIKKLFQKFII